MHSESFLNYDVDLSIKLPSEKVGVSSVLALKRPRKNKLKKVEKNCKKSVDISEKMWYYIQAVDERGRQKLR